MDHQLNEGVRSHPRFRKTRLPGFSGSAPLAVGDGNLTLTGMVMSYQIYCHTDRLALLPEGVAARKRRTQIEKLILNEKAAREATAAHATPAPPKDNPLCEGVRQFGSSRHSSHS